ncbi:MAG: ABC transporter ATP-binding protein [Rhizobiaceae bacterium]
MASDGGAAAPFIEVRGLQKLYRTRGGATVGLNGVGVDIRPGEFTVLLGPSGCGKTTLLRCLAGLERPQKGVIRIGGRTVFSADDNIWVPAEKRGLSMVFQSYALWPHLNVFGNIAFPLRTAGLPKAEVDERVRAVLRLVHLEGYAESYAGQLSGGQQQRVALARAIVGQSSVVLFDEPLSNLDAKVRNSLRRELLQLQRQLGFAAVFVTHDQEEAMALAGQIVVMDKGRISQVGTPRATYGQPSSRYVAGFIGEINEMPGRVVHRDGNRLTVAVPTGEIVAEASDSGLDVGAAVTAMFRPRNCRWEAAPGGGENSLTGRVEHSIYLGGYSEIAVSVDGTPMALRLEGEDAPPPGGEIHFSIEPGKVWVFPDDRAGAS